MKWMDELNARDKMQGLVHAPITGFVPIWGDAAKFDPARWAFRHARTPRPASSIGCCAPSQYAFSSDHDIAAGKLSTRGARNASKRRARQTRFSRNHRIARLCAQVCFAGGDTNASSFDALQPSRERVELRAPHPAWHVPQRHSGHCTSLSRSCIYASTATDSASRPSSLATHFIYQSHPHCVRAALVDAMRYGLRQERCIL